jgi:hypothetical protein
MEGYIQYTLLLRHSAHGWVALLLSEWQWRGTFSTPSQLVPHTGVEVQRRGPVLSPGCTMLGLPKDR